MPKEESVPDAETRIHGSINKYYEIDATERAKWDTDTFFHPLQDTWVKGLTMKPDESEKALWCWRDCQERDRIRRMECDEIRKRIEQKLKELGCPTQLIAIDTPSPCGGGITQQVTAVQQQQPQYMPMPMPMAYYMPQQQG